MYDIISLSSLAPDEIAISRPKRIYRVSKRTIRTERARERERTRENKYVSLLEKRNLGVKCGIHFSFLFFFSALFVGFSRVLGQKKKAVKQPKQRKQQKISLCDAFAMFLSLSLQQQH